MSGLRALRTTEIGPEKARLLLQLAPQAAARARQPRRDTYVCGQLTTHRPPSPPCAHRAAAMTGEQRATRRVYRPMSQ
eukprot:COSAG05_NODE_7628_length_787_cov_1.434593_2_plen_78_part_00